jgi:hypothetical protein
MFLLGAAGFIHEVLWAQQERPVIIAACCALMGLPFVLRGEDALREERTRRQDEDSK